MGTYKQKYLKVISNSLKDVPYKVKDGTIILNLNACFVKKNNFAKFNTIIREALQYGNIINLCNLASLCYKFNIPYSSIECLDFVSKVVDCLHVEDNSITLVQSGVYNCGEIDLQPICDLVRFDNTQKVLWVNNILLDTLKILGFVDTQVYDLVEFTNNFSKILPKDIINTLPITTQQNIQTYEIIRDLL